MIGKEIIRTLRQYFSVDGKLQYWGDDKTVKALTEMFATAKPYGEEAPDMYFIKGNRVLIIEHFEFDCYHAAKNGSSSFRREEARIKRVFDAVPLTEQRITVMRDVIRGKSSYEDYVKNVRRNFLKHYKKIDKYFEKLKEVGVIREETDVKVMFLIDDVSPLGALVVDNNDKWNEGDTSSVQLSCSIEFLNLLTDSPKVDYVISCSTCFSNPMVWFISRNNLSAYYQHSVDYASMRFLSLTPHVIEVRTIVPSVN